MYEFLHEKTDDELKKLFALLPPFRTDSLLKYLEKHHPKLLLEYL